MIGFQAPLWLLLLGLIPLIRWIHRFRLQSRILPSTTLFLWSRLQPYSADDGNPGKPDLRWILRALISSLMILALAQPRLQSTEGPTLEAWIDDSLSMFTQEAGHSRLQAGLHQLQSYLGEREFSLIRLHSLGEPGKLLSLDPKHNAGWGAQLNTWLAQPRAEPLPPPVVTLSQFSKHILITDGADDALNRWAKSAPLSRIIQAGELRQNLALSRLNIRNSLTDSGAIAGTVRIDNLGDITNSLRLVIEQQESIIERFEFEIPPLGNRLASFSIPAGSTGSLEARLESRNDPLPLDNGLRLDIADLQSSVGYSVIGDCDPRLMAVIDSHPALVSVDERADVQINCGAGTQDSTLPALLLHPASGLHRTTQTAHWHEALSTGYLPVAAGVAYSDAAPTLSSANTPILSANGRMLISKRPGADRVIDCYLDSGDTVFSREAQYPLLILGLLSRLSGHSLETTPLTVSRDPRASRITPMTLPVSAAAEAVHQPTEIPYTNPILFAVFLLLLLDAALGLFAASGKLNWQA